MTPLLFVAATAFAAWQVGESGFDTDGWYYECGGYTATWGSDGSAFASVQAISYGFNYECDTWWEFLGNFTTVDDSTGFSYRQDTNTGTQSSLIITAAQGEIEAWNDYFWVIPWGYLYH